MPRPKRYVYLLAAVAMFLVAATLACNKLDHGTIVDKSCAPAYTTTEHLDPSTGLITPYFSGSNYVPLQVQHDAMFSVLVRGDYGGQTFDEWHNIAGRDYWRLKIGEPVDFR